MSKADLFKILRLACKFCYFILKVYQLVTSE
jgi:hypothetical protein